MKNPARTATMACLALLLASCSSGNDIPSTFAFATGGPTGLYYPFGGAMSSIWSKQLPHVNVKAEVTGGSVINVIQVARKESEIGIAMADVVTDAYLGRGRFDGPLPLRVLFSAYPNIVHILTLQDSGVTSVADLRGKRVSLGAAGSGTANAAQSVLAGLGVGLEEFAPAYLNFGETTSALKDGTISAGFVVGGIGLAAVTELAVTRDLHLVALSNGEIAQLNTAFPAYAAYGIPAGTYNGIDVVTQTLGIWSAVVVHESMPEQLAYELVCTLFQHREKLLEVSQAARDMQVVNVDKLTTVPLHPGTQRYLQHTTAAGPDNCIG